MPYRGLVGWQGNCSPGEEDPCHAGQVSLGCPGRGCGPMPGASRTSIYAVALTKEDGEYRHRLHALDLADGTEKLGGPVVIQGSVVGAGSGRRAARSPSRAT